MKRKGRKVAKETMTLSKKDVAKVSDLLTPHQQAAREVAKNHPNKEVKPNDGSPAVAKVVEAVNVKAETPDPVPAKPMKIKVLKPDAKYRGAREAWFMRLKEFDGKTEEEYIESCKKVCPQLTRAQTAENPTGWVSFFKREGVLSLQPA